MDAATPSGHVQGSPQKPLQRWDLLVYEPMSRVQEGVPQYRGWVHSLSEINKSDNADYVK